jgi:voltage-gated potassium channel
MRVAIAAITSVTIAAVLVGALLMWAFDRANYPSYGQAVWLTLQTVTTAGYGDTTPTTGIGRSVASVVMLAGIGLITVVTAAVTSVFIEAARVRMERSRAEAAAKEPDPLEPIAATLAEISQRLERLEASQHVDDRGQSPP